MFVVIVICHGSQHHTNFDRLIKPVFLFPTLCRFIFCQTVLTLYAPVSNKKEFLPTCVPSLPKPVLPPSYSYQSVILHLANIFGATKYFVFSDDVLPENMHTETWISYELYEDKQELRLKHMMYTAFSCIKMVVSFVTYLYNICKLKRKSLSCDVNLLSLYIGTFLNSW